MNVFQVENLIQFLICDRESMYSSVGTKSQREKSYKKHMLEASLEFDLHFGHSSFNFLNGVESTNEVSC